IAPPIAADEPWKLVPISLPGDARGGYDPAARFAELHPFVFSGPALGQDVPAGTSLGTPADRTIRRLIAEQLTLRGLRQAGGQEPTALVTAFSGHSPQRTA